MPGSRAATLPLNPRQKRFVEGVMSGLSRAAAYRYAGYSEKSSRSRGPCRLFAHAGVQQAIAAALAAAGVMPVAEVLQRLSHKARVADKDTDQLTALTLLAKHHKLITEKIEHSGTVTWDQLVPKRKPPEGSCP